MNCENAGSTIAWPPGEGEMAARIRAHGWAATPLGPIEGWPQSLRTATEMVLAMPGPATILWGPASIQIYNDAYVAIAQDRHPALLGRPVAEGWPDVYEGVVAPLIQASRAGRVTRLADIPVALRGPDGRPQERAFDTDWSPIRDESGAVAGALQMLVEVTERHRAEAALRASELRFRALVTTGSPMLYRMSPDWRFMYGLDGRGVLADTTGPIGDWVERYILPEDRAGVFAAIGDAIASRSVFELEHRVRQADGSVGWVLSRAVPILRPDGEIAEWFGAGIDVSARRDAETALRESEERQAFLLKLSDALRPLGDPGEIQKTAARVLGRHLGACRVAYAENDPKGEAFVVSHNYADGVPEIVGPYRYADYGSDILAELQAGRTRVQPDIARDGRLGEAEKQALAEVGVGASLNVPLVKGGRLVAFLGVNYRAAHDFSPREIALVTEVAERTWAAVERARAEAALRESEAKLAVELADARQLHRISSSLIVEDDVAAFYDRILDAARSLMRSDFASLQVFVPERNELVLLAHHGFAPESAEHWKRIRLDHGTSCALAMAQGEQTIVTDAEQCGALAGTEDLAEFRRSGIRSMQSTPLVSREGGLVGVISTHWRDVREPGNRELRLFDVVARQAADLVERRAANEKLRNSEEKYRTLFETMGQGYADIELMRDADGRAVDQRYLELNPAFERLIGVPPAEARGRTAREVLPHLEPWWHEAFDRVAKRGEPERIEYGVGSLGRWFEVFAYPRGGDHLTVLYADITERKRAEQALRESQRLQSTMLEVLPLGLAIIGADRGVILSNPEWARFLPNGRIPSGDPERGWRWRARDGEGRPVDPEDYPGARALRGEHVVPGMDFLHTDDSGSETWTSVAAVPLRDDRGEVVGAVSIIHEIDAAKRASEALREGEERLRLALEAGGLGAFRWHVADDRLEPDARTRAILGVSRTDETSLARMLADRIHPDDAARHAEAVARAIDPSGSGQLREELRIVHPSDGTRWVTVTGRVRFGGEPRAAWWIDGVVSDITDRKRAEAALHESEQSQAFLLRLSDALRPLADPVAIQETASRMTAEHLDVGRVGYCEIRHEPDIVVLVERDWPRRGMPSIAAGRYRMDDFGTFLAETMTAGRPAAVADAPTDPRLSAADRGNWAAFGIVAHCSLPVIKDGRFVAYLVAQDNRPHPWTDREVALLGEVSERTWSAVERARAEAALRESEERFRTLTASIEDVFYMTDLGRNALDYLSPSYERVWGRPAAALLADLPSFLDTLHPDDRPAFHATKAAQERGEPVAVEYRIRRPDGAVRWIFDRSFPVGDGTGQRSAGIASDVTARKDADAALRESEERFRKFAEASSDVIWIRNGETMTYEYVSPAFTTVYGQPIESVLDGFLVERWAELILPEDREGALDGLRRVRAGERVTHEFRIRRPDGEVRWIRNTDFPLLDESGRVQRLGGIGQDVTELKGAEAAIAESEARLRTLTEGIPQLVWRAVDGGRWTWASPQWVDYTGLSDAQSRDRGWLHALHPDDRDGTMTAWRGAEAAGVFAVEYRICHRGEDRHRWFSTRATPVRGRDGRILEWLGTSTDIDDLRRLQDEQKVMVAELQHRTRNLIAVVRSIAGQTMAQTGPTEAFRAQFNDRLAALSRVQGLLSRASETPITIRQLIRMELDALGAEEVEGRITLEGPEAPLRSSVVQTLALALHELATNARKYGSLATERGVLSVTWNVRRADGAGRRLALEWVEDGLDLRREEQSPVRKGYGRELIERALPYALDAKTSYELDDRRVRCTIDLPLDKPGGSRDRT